MNPKPDPWAKPKGYCPCFLYGSNLDERQMKKICTNPLAGPKAILEGHRIEFAGRSQTWKGRGQATLVPTPGHTVHGRLWWLSQSDLRKLDQYEGHPHRYRRCKSPIIGIWPKGSSRPGELLKLDAWVYTMSAQALRAPHPDYVQIIETGLHQAKYNKPGLAFTELGEAVNRSIHTENIEIAKLATQQRHGKR